MTMTSGLNVICSQTPGSLFPSHQLKGNCTLTAPAATIRNDAAEGDPGVEQEGEERQSLQLTRRWKCQVELERLISLSNMSLTLLKQLNYTKRKIRTAWGVGALTISYETT